jgi:hypothetical protein
MSEGEIEGGTNFRGLCVEEEERCEREDEEEGTHEGVSVEGHHLCWRLISKVGRQCQWLPTVQHGWHSIRVHRGRQ